MGIIPAGGSYRSEEVARGDIRLLSFRSVTRRPDDAGGCPKHPLLQVKTNSKVAQVATITLQRFFVYYMIMPCRLRVRSVSKYTPSSWCELDFLS